ncbi:hypothetical protein Pryu01_02657 [Paraliobacillus ryukyuensis]|uniref:Uncharacterized protein DUF4350 n=1 Tax=Paraliobacillus ryukyuensis TaxID=200904 RepID=A0A366DZ63_9BACI|nr:DUF4350 domain-containing protein [Paraliobacillus ryukyuensis]RBO95327.1 uncharacterized protein DUF4350 [Paraliobacillus ryukyuensis]
MAQQPIHKNTWIWLLILLTLFVICSYIFVPEKPEEYPPYVSNSPAPTGTKAIYTYLEENQLPIKKWELPPSNLANRENTLQVMVEPSLFSEENTLQAYQAYVENGNTLAIFKHNPKGMFDIETTNPTMSIEDTVELINHDLEVATASSLRLKPDEDDEILLADHYGPIAIKRSIGAGSLIVVTEPEWLTNTAILENDHLEALFTVLNFNSYDAILFNEYVHGNEAGTSMLSVFPNWIIVLAFELLLVTVGVLWLKGKRFGPIITPREATVRFSDEKIKALATWYMKGKNYREAIGIQADFLKRLLLERFGIPYKNTWSENTEAIERTLPNLSKEAIRRFTNGLDDVLKQEKVSKQAFLSWSQKIDHIRREVEAE